MLANHDVMIILASSDPFESGKCERGEKKYKNFKIWRTKRAL